jgi:hypothetical protein
VPTSTYKIHVPDPFLDTSTPVAAPRGYKDDDDFPF